MDNILGIFTNVFLIFFTQFIRINRFAVLYHNFGRRHFGEVCLENVCGVADRDWDDRTFCFGCNLEASFMEREHFQFILISASGSLRENTDGDSGLYFVYCCEDGLESLFDVFSVKEQTVEIAHPCG